MMQKSKKYWIGQYVGCKMMSGEWKLCRIIKIYEPGKYGPFCERETYTEIYFNHNKEHTFWIDWGGISIPKIFFNSKKDAELWFLKRQVAELKKNLREEKALTKRIVKRLHSLKKVLRKLV